MITVLMLLGASAILRRRSFLSSNDPCELNGAGQAGTGWAEVQWPAPSHHVDRYLTLAEGGGT